MLVIWLRGAQNTPKTDLGRSKIVPGTSRGATGYLEVPRFWVPEVLPLEILGTIFFAEDPFNSNIMLGIFGTLV